MHQPNFKVSIYKLLKKNYHNKDVDFSKDYYAILGVSKTSTDKEIKTAYHKLALLNHPDVNHGKTTEKFKEMTAAYEVLSNKEKRAIYDSGNPSGSSFKNPFAGGFGFGNFQNQNYSAHKTDHNYNTNEYKSNGTNNYYSNFNNFENFNKKFKNNGFYKEYYETYTFNDKDGKTKTYTYQSKANSNPFYQDLDDLIKRRKAEREHREKMRNTQAGNNRNTDNSSYFYGNDFRGKNPFNKSDPYNNFRNPQTQAKFNDEFIYRKFSSSGANYSKFYAYLVIGFSFTLIYGLLMKRRSEYYQQQNYGSRFVMNEYSRPIYTPSNYDQQYHSHYNHNPEKRTYFYNHEVPPYK